RLRHLFHALDRAIVSRYEQSPPRPLRLEAQDTALSRRQHRFESGRGRQQIQWIRAWYRLRLPRNTENLRNRCSRTCLDNPACETLFERIGARLAVADR